MNAASPRIHPRVARAPADAVYPLGSCSANAAPPRVSPRAAVRELPLTRRVLSVLARRTSPTVRFSTRRCARASANAVCPLGSCSVNAAPAAGSSARRRARASADAVCPFGFRSVNAALPRVSPRAAMRAPPLTRCVLSVPSRRTSPQSRVSPCVIVGQLPLTRCVLSVSARRTPPRRTFIRTPRVLPLTRCVLSVLARRMPPSRAFTRAPPCACFR